MSVDFRFDRNDYGIVFRGTTSSAPTTYVDIWGQTRQAVQLQNGVEVFMDQGIESAYFHVGSAQAFSLEVEVDLHSGDSLSLALHGEATNLPVDGTSPALQTMRNDTGVPASSQAFAAAGKVMLQTDNLTSLTTGAIGVTGAVAGIEGTEITVHMRVLR